MSRHTAVIFGGPTPEHDVSILTGLVAARTLRDAGHDACALYWSKTGEWHRVDAALEGSAFLQGVPASAVPVVFHAHAGGGFFTHKKGVLGEKTTAIDIDTAIVCCHGGPGEDGSLQGALDLAGVRYAGPSVAGAAIGMDKFAFGAVVAQCGFPTLSRLVVTQDMSNPDFAGPYIVKPRFGGSSIGIEVVDNIATAKALVRSGVQYRAGAVLEPYLADSFDLNVAVRMYPTPQVSAIEKPFRASGDGARILGYADKYVGGEGMVAAPRELPARVDEATRTRIETIALSLAEVMGVRGIARIDFLSHNDKLYVNEINTIPGSLAKFLWVDPEIPFLALLNDMIAEANERSTIHWTTQGADGTALQSAGAIASKLA